MGSAPATCRCHVCRPAAELSDRRRLVVDHVRDFGWHAVGVLADDEVPAWAYSVGLWHTLSRAEVCVFGLPPQTGMKVINAAGEWLRSGGDLFADEVSSEVLNNHDVAVRRVDPSWHEDLFGQALGFYRGRTPTFLQLVWPDREGRFPWDEGVDEHCRQVQPMLWLPWSEHPRGVWTRLREAPDWPFGEICPDTAVFTMKAVAEGNAQVTGVYRDHGGVWQFLDGTEPSVDAITNVHLKHVVDLHPYVGQFSNLQPGEQAWQQSDGSWHRSTVPPEENVDA